MAFLRFTRDKRGYEYFYLVQPSTRRGKSSARLLYWFRTPPNVKVGREPFDEAIRRELEAGNPDVMFDWRKILDTPIPSADAEKWRDRRRAERAARAARRAAAQEPAVGEDSRTEQEQTAEEAVTTDEEMAVDDEMIAAPVHVLEAAAEAAVAANASDTSLHAPDLSAASESNEDADKSNAQPEQPPSPLAQDRPVELRPAGSGEPSRRRRRRRRRNRGRSGPAGPAGNPPAGTGGDV
jgi:hypothetical protein